MVQSLAPATGWDLLHLLKACSRSRLWDVDRAYACTCCQQQATLVHSDTLEHASDSSLAILVDASACKKQVQNGPTMCQDGVPAAGCRGPDGDLPGECVLTPPTWPWRPGWKDFADVKLACTGRTRGCLLCKASTLWHCLQLLSSKSCIPKWMAAACQQQSIICQMDRIRVPQHEVGKRLQDMHCMAYGRLI